MLQAGGEASDFDPALIACPPLIFGPHITTRPPATLTKFSDFPTSLRYIFLVDGKACLLSQWEFFYTWSLTKLNYGVHYDFSL